MCQTMDLLRAVAYITNAIIPYYVDAGLLFVS